MKSNFLQINQLVSLTSVSAILAYPLSFKDTGRILSVSILLIQAVINYRATKVYISKSICSGEPLDMVVSRSLGRQWGQCVLITQIIYLLQLTLLYSFYALDIFFDVSSYIVQHVMHIYSINKGADLQLNTYSMLYSTLIFSPAILFIVFRQTTQTFKKYFLINTISILFYMCYLMKIFVENINKIDHRIGSTPIYFNKIANFLGSNNLAFSNQLYLHLVLSLHNGKINQSSLSYSTITIFLIYAFVGIFGSLAIQHASPINPAFNNIIFDYFPESILTVISKIFLIYHFISNLSYKYILLRNNLLKFLMNKNNIQHFEMKKQRMQSILNVIFAIFIVSVNIITSNLQYKFTIITGSLAGFILIYLVPYKLKFRSIKRINKQIKKNTFLNIQNSFMHNISILQVQESDSDLFEFDTDSLIDRRMLNYKKQNLTTKIQQIQRKPNFFDKIILLFGFLISIYGIIYFIYFLMGN